MEAAQTAQGRILSGADGAPVEVLNADGDSCVVLACEHASNRVPGSLNGLGLDAAALRSHIAWDPGARSVALGLSRSLDAPLVASRISRLVYDCNRPPDSPAAMPVRSERFDIPGNAGLSEGARAARVREIYRPFRARLGAMLDRRAAGRAPVCLVTIHSFTPVYFETRREVELGILHDSDARLADLMLARASEITGLRSGRNQPYGPEDGVTHTLREHALPRGIPNVMIEIRNDLLEKPRERDAITSALARLIETATETLKRNPKRKETR